MERSHASRKRKPQAQPHPQSADSPLLQTRPFAEPASSSPQSLSSQSLSSQSSSPQSSEPPSLQTQREPLGHRLDEMSLYPPQTNEPIANPTSQTANPTSQTAIQAKLTIGQPNDRYEQEADRVAEQVVQRIHANPREAPTEAATPSVQRWPQRLPIDRSLESLGLQAQSAGIGQSLKVPAGLVQRKVGKLPNSETLSQKASAGKKLFGTSGYQEVLNAIAQYHKLKDDNYRGQLSQLISISRLIRNWEISHSDVDATKNKNAKEKGRRGVLADIKHNYLPEETAGVYKQAKDKQQAFDVNLLQQLMDIMDGNPALRGAIELDYGSALRSYSTTQQDIDPYKQLLKSGKSQLMTGRENAAGYMKSYAEKKKSLQEDIEMGQEQLEQVDSSMPLYQRIQQDINLYQAQLNALNQMSETEYAALKFYTGSGYIPMNSNLRRLDKTVTGADKKQRQADVQKRDETMQAVKMASSALNKLPDHDGSPLYRSEDLSGREHLYAKGKVVVLQAFTSTTFSESKKNTFGGDALTIRGVTSSGKRVKFLSDNAGEDEVLLKPYTKIKIDSCEPKQNGGKGWEIVAHEV